MPNSKIFSPITIGPSPNIDVSHRVSGHVPLGRKFAEYSSADRMTGLPPSKRLSDQASVPRSAPTAHSSIDRISEALRNQVSLATDGHQTGGHLNIQAAHAQHLHEMRTSMTNLPFRPVAPTGLGPYSSFLAPVSCPQTMAMPPSLLQFPSAMYPPAGAPTPSGASEVKPMALAQYAGVAGPHAAFPTDWSKYKAPLINRNYLELAMLVCNTFRGKLFPCPHCRYVTDRRNNLKRHISTMHQACDKILECCGVHFNTKASLREHIMIFHHNGYSCPYCGRRFCRKALLKRHLSVHSGQKDYSCPNCDYATSHKSNLERHKRIHDRLKNYDDNAIIDVENLHDAESDSEYLPEPEAIEMDVGDLSDCEELNVTDEQGLVVFSDRVPVKSPDHKDCADGQISKQSENYGALDLCTTSH